MTAIVQLILIIAPVALLIFWMWMFSEMMKNGEIPSNIKQQWLFAFIFLNIFTAIFYYINVYRNE